MRQMVIKYCRCTNIPISNLEIWLLGKVIPKDVLAIWDSRYRGEKLSSVFTRRLPPKQDREDGPSDEVPDGSSPYWEE
jgi:hypothetical protein